MLFNLLDSATSSSPTSGGGGGWMSWVLIIGLVLVIVFFMVLNSRSAKKRQKETQEMLDAFAEQFVGKQLPVVLHADADETTAEEQIVEGMENQLENSRGIVEMLNKLAEQ